ncbi:potassium channel subfamily K member 1-like [Protopterus annectens]|uniref:potassium channel subfamily K member 1-like n=1 Tax=Protopterus annectens TaxID=7888 RepID=UPI001CFBAB3A|nr:potassium channel subfamily K member 1-like [Protopterus annectens]
MKRSLSDQPFVELIKNNKTTCHFIILLISYFLFLIFGAVVFSCVELPYEDLFRQDLRNQKKQFLEDNSCVSEQKLEKFLETILEASNYGVSVLNNVSGSYNWDFPAALFFASTVLSTTGK